MCVVELSEFVVYQYKEAHEGRNHVRVAKTIRNLVAVYELEEGMPLVDVVSRSSACFRVKSHVDLTLL